MEKKEGFNPIAQLQEKKDINHEEGRIDRSWDKVFESDIMHAKSLDEIRSLIQKKEFIDNPKNQGDFVGIDKSGMNFADDIVTTINDAEKRVLSGADLTDDDIRQITSAFGIRKRVLELLKAQRAEQLL